MNEENKNLEHQQSKLQTQQDAQLLQSRLLEKKELLIDESPKLNLSVKRAPFYLDVLFEKDGSPKGNFRVSDRYKKKVFFAFKHPHTKSNTGELYYGELSQGDYFSGNYYPNEYLIVATPTFLSDEELQMLQSKKEITKKINNVDITFVAPILQESDYSSRVEKYRESIVEPRKKVQELDSLVAEIEGIKSKLPRGSYEVIIEQPEEKESGFPHR